MKKFLLGILLGLLCFLNFDVSFASFTIPVPQITSNPVLPKENILDICKNEEFKRGSAETASKYIKILWAMLLVIIGQAIAHFILYKHFSNRRQELERDIKSQKTENENVIRQIVEQAHILKSVQDKLEKAERNLMVARQQVAALEDIKRTFESMLKTNCGLEKDNRRLMRAIGNVYDKLLSYYDAREDAPYVFITRDSDGLRETIMHNFYTVSQATIRSDGKPYILFIKCLQCKKHNVMPHDAEMHILQKHSPKG